MISSNYEQGALSLFLQSPAALGIKTPPHHHPARSPPSVSWQQGCCECWVCSVVPVEGTRHSQQHLVPGAPVLQRFTRPAHSWPTLIEMPCGNLITTTPLCLNGLMCLFVVHNGHSGSQHFQEIAIQWLCLLTWHMLLFMCGKTAVQRSYSTLTIRTCSTCSAPCVNFPTFIGEIT